MRLRALGENQLCTNYNMNERSTVEVIVPDPDDGQEHRKIILQWRFSEVLVHVVCAAKEFFEIIVANDECDRQTYGTPERIPSADPVPEAKHVILGNTERGDGLLVRREGDEVLCNVSPILRGCKEPFACRL